MGSHLMCQILGSKDGIRQVQIYEISLDLQYMNIECLTTKLDNLMQSYILFKRMGSYFSVYSDYADRRNF